MKALVLESLPISFTLSLVLFLNAGKFIKRSFNMSCISATYFPVEPAGRHYRKIKRSFLEHSCYGIDTLVST